MGSTRPDPDELNQKLQGFDIHAGLDNNPNCD